MKKLSNTEAELKKALLVKKACKCNILKDDYQNNKEMVIAYVHYFLYFSSNVNEVIRVVLNFLFFLRDDFTRTRKRETLTANKNKTCA